MESINVIDRKFLDLAIESARKSYDLGSFPVGAVLTIDDNLIGVGENRIDVNKSYFYHAETSLIEKYSHELYEAGNHGKDITIYSTLEPCIQCLGVSVINFVNKIIYITKDPQGGACDVKHMNIGFVYKKRWPKIIYAPVSNEPFDLLMKHFDREIAKGNKWGQHMHDLFKDSR